MKQDKFNLKLQLFGEAGEEGNEGAGDKGGEENKDNDEKKFSQKELGSILSKERAEAKASLLKELGFEKPEDLKSIIDKQREQDEKNKSFETKYQEAEQRAEQAKAEAEAVKTEADIKIKMYSKGFTDDQISDFIGLVKGAEDKEKEIDRLAEKYQVIKGDNKGSAGAGFTGNGKEGAGTEKPGFRLR